MSADRNSPGFLARSKLEPGVPVVDRVERRLEAEGLEGLRAARLTLVHAPAGYGKTTLLGQWFRRLRDAGSRVAWLSLDEFDATVDQFAGNLLEACAEAGFFRRRQWIEAEHPDSSRRLLLATLSGCEGEHVLVFDDLHRAASADVVRCLNLLVEDLPRGFRVVLGTRALPAELVTADLRLHDRLFEVSDSELRFSEDDVVAYFGPRLGERDKQAVVERLLQRTEGWPGRRSRWFAAASTTATTSKPRCTTSPAVARTSPGTSSSRCSAAWTRTSSSSSCARRSSSASTATSAVASTASPGDGPCWRNSNAATSSCTRSTTPGSGFATTACSASSCWSACAATARNSGTCTRAPRPGSTSTGTCSRPCSMPSGAHTPNSLRRSSSPSAAGCSPCRATSAWSNARSPPSKNR